MTNIFPIDFEEKNDIAQDDYILFSDSEDWNKLKKAQYSNLKWEKWDTWNPWAAATITVWSTTTWEPWTSASVTNSGTSSAAVFNFTIPKGAKWQDWTDWEAATITVWSTTTLPAWSSATVTNSWTSQDAILEFGIPQGDQGVWVDVEDQTLIILWSWGTWSWDVVWPSSAIDGHLAVFKWATWKVIKDGWAIPTPVTVVDALNSTSTTSALSANQWRILDWKISDMMWLWKFLSLWDATTWLPISFPLETPYTYTTWDYFLVETISTATPPVNYKPVWSSYDGTASSTAETWEVQVWDYYVYDWSIWLLASNHGKSVTFANIAWNPTDNTSLANALSGKQDVSNLVTSVSSSSTDSQYPSAKLFYDTCWDIETLINAL